MKILLLSLSLLLFTACSNTIDTTGHKAYQSINKQQIIKESPLTFSIIQTGDGTTLESFVYEGGSWFSSFKIAHSAFLIKHPKGNLLLDSGLGREVDRGFDEEFPWYLKPIFKFNKTKAAADTLKENNISIDGTILTHAHWDHASGIKDFGALPIYTTKEELKFAKQEWDDVAYMKDALDGDNINWNFITFDEKPYENFEKSFDYYGDGSLVLVPLEGHSPGQIGIFINTAQHRYFLSGDTTWAYDALLDPREKYWFSSYLADADAEQNINSILQVHALMQQQPELIVIPSHDYKVQKRVGFFPKVIN